MSFLREKRYIFPQYTELRALTEDCRSVLTWRRRGSRTYSYECCIIVNANFLPQLSTLALLSKLINWNLTTTCTHRGRPDRYTHLPNLVALRERKKARKLITTAEDAVSRRSENLRRRKQAKVKKFERRIRRTFFLYTATTKNAFSNFAAHFLQKRGWGDPLDDIHYSVGGHIF